MNRSSWITIGFCAILGTTATSQAGEEIVFPAAAGIVDVKRDYDARGDGVTDDTQAFQRALLSRPLLLYVPAGVYVVSDTLSWGKGQKRTVLQGQGPQRTIIRLKDACAAFADARHTKAVLWTGNPPAQRFRNGVRDLTIDTGRNNPGATGMQFIANNQGVVANVTIRSQDGLGVVGLDLGYVNEQGPCLIKNVSVRGFDVGIRTRYGVDSVTMEHIQLEGQRQAGLHNQDQVLSVRGLTSRNRVPAVINEGAGLLTLVDASLTTPDKVESAAITNAAALFARNVTIEGYAAGIANTAGHGQGASAGSIVEWVSHPVLSLFPTPPRSLGLAIEETPKVPWGDAARNWASVADYKPVEREVTDPKGKKHKVPDWAPAIQAAVDSGAKTVYFPPRPSLGGYAIYGPVVLRKNVQRVIGLETQWRNDPAAGGEFILADGESPVVVFERFDFSYQPVKVRHASKRTLVLANVYCADYQAEAGCGPLFIEDVFGGPWTFVKGQHVWARQLNPETKTTKITNDGATLWILGLKGENDGTYVHTRAGGKTEVLGCFAYANSNRPKPAMFVNEQSDFSAVVGEQVMRNAPFEPTVQETRDGQTRTLERSQTPGRAGGAMLPLYVGYRQQQFPAQ